MNFGPQWLRQAAAGASPEPSRTESPASEREEPIQQKHQSLTSPEVVQEEDVDGGDWNFAGKPQRNKNSAKKNQNRYSNQRNENRNYEQRKKTSYFNQEHTSEIMTTPLEPSIYRYSKEWMLSMFQKNENVPDIMQRHEVVLSEESVEPISLQDPSPEEKAVLESGSLNSNVSQRKNRDPNFKGGRGRGRGRGNYHGDREDRFKEKESHANDDLWDSPLTGTAGTFANGAFTMDETNEPKKSAPSSRMPFALESNDDPLSLISDGKFIDFEKALEPAGDTWTGTTSTKNPISLLSALKQPVTSQIDELKQVLETLPQPVWVYKDPAGRIQGPFTGDEMQIWYESGYFPDDLLIKQTHENNFEGLVNYMNRHYQGQLGFTRPNIPLHIQDQLISLKNSDPSSFARLVTGVFPGLLSNQAPSRVVAKEIVQPRDHSHEKQALDQRSRVVEQRTRIVEQRTTEIAPQKTWDPTPGKIVETLATLQVNSVVRAPSPKRPSPGNERNTSPVVAKVEPPVENAWGKSKSVETKPISDIQKEDERIKKAKAEVKVNSPVVAVKKYSDVSKTSAPLKPVSPGVGTPKSEMEHSESRESFKSAVDSMTSTKPEPSSGEVNWSLLRPPSDVFIKWLKDELKQFGGSFDVQSFVEIISTVNDPFMISTIIRDSIDPADLSQSQFTLKFLQRRALDSNLPGKVSVPRSNSPMKEEVSSRPAKKSDGFTVVGKKKKEKKQAAPVGHGGRKVVGLN